MEDWIFAKVLQKCAAAVTAASLLTLVLKIQFMMVHAFLPATESMIFNLR
jgi:hypothetical protein